MVLIFALCGYLDGSKAFISEIMSYFNVPLRIWYCLSKSPVIVYAEVPVLEFFFVYESVIATVLLCLVIVCSLSFLHSVPREVCTSWLWPSFIFLLRTMTRGDTNRIFKCLNEFISKKRCISICSRIFKNVTLANLSVILSVKFLLESNSYKHCQGPADMERPVSRLLVMWGSPLRSGTLQSPSFTLNLLMQFETSKQKI